MECCSVTNLCPALCDPMDCVAHQASLSSPSPRVCSNSCPLSWRCHPTISFSVVPFFFAFSFSQDQSFSMSRLFASSGQSIGASASVSKLPMNSQCWFPLGLTDVISLQSRRLSTVFSSPTIQKHQFFGAQPSSWSNTHIPYITTGKTIDLTLQTFVTKVMFVVFNTVSRLVIFSSKEEESFNFKASVTINIDFGAREYKIYHCYHFFPFYLPPSNGTGYHDLSFLNAEFQASFFTLLFSPSSNSL